MDYRINMALNSRASRQLSEVAMRSHISDDSGYHLDYRAFEAGTMKYSMSQSQYKSLDRISSLSSLEKSSQFHFEREEEYPDESIQMIKDFITDKHGIKKKAFLGELKVQVITNLKLKT